MEFMLGFFAGLSLQYWILLAVICGSLILTVYNEQFQAEFLFAVGAFGYFAYHLIKPEYIDWVSLAYFVVVYLLIGLVWSFKKWFSFARVKYKEHIDREKRMEQEYPFKLNVKDHKERLIIWILYWPLSMIGYIIGDLFRDLIDWIISRFSGFYNYLTEKAKF
jgi:predicted membrane protein